MNRHSLLALSVAAALALPIGLSSKALALTADDQQALSQTAIVGGATMQATIAAVLKAQGDPALVEAIVAQASADAASDMPGSGSAAVLASFLTASTSPLIDTANRAAVQNSVIAASGTGDGIGASTTFGGETIGAGGGPNLGGMNVVYVQTGFGGNYSERTSRGQAISPN